MTIGNLNLLFGQIPGSGMLEDLEDFINLKKEEIFELIDKIIEWYPKEDIDKEWNEWASKLEEDEKGKKKNAIRLLLFIGKGIAGGSISEAEVRSDIEKMGIPKEYFDYLLTKITQNSNFKNKVLSNRRPFENVLSDIDWRIDKRTYCDKTEELIAIIEFIYNSKGKKETISFDFNIYAIRHLISILRNIEEVLCKK